MPEYEIRSDGKLVRKGASDSTPSSTAQSLSGASSSSHGTAYPNTTSSGYSYTPRTANRSSNTGTKTFAILFPILFFIIGQIIQYSVYFESRKALLLDIIFGTTPIGVLILSSILGIVNVILITTRCWILADDDELGYSWTYIILSSIALAIVPGLFGFVGFVLTIAITACCSNVDDDYIPSWIVVMSFITGQVLFWSSFLRTEKMPFVYNFLKSEQVWFDDQITIAVVTAVITLIATILYCITIYNTFEDYESGIATSSLIIYSLLVLIVPHVSSVILLCFAIISRIVAANSDDETAGKTALWGTIIASIAVIVCCFYLSSIKPYIVVLDPQYKGGEFIEVEAFYGKDMPPTNMPTRNGYRLVGYFDENGMQYYDSYMGSCHKWDRESGGILYARWEVIEVPNNDYDPGCVAAGTGVLLSSGNVISVENISIGDKVLTWDFISQTFVETSVALLVNHGEKENEVITLIFEDQTSIRIIDSHVFFDLTTGAYVTIDKDNYSTYVGHDFMSYQIEGESYASKKLVTAIFENEKTNAYAIVTNTHYSCITNNLITATPTIPGIYQLISSYLDKDLQFDVDCFSNDVEEHGTYEYSMFAEYLSYEQFVQLCAPFYKIAEEKGYTSYEELYDFIVKYSYILQ